jgi:hypothetical protein
MRARLFDVVAGLALLAAANCVVHATTFTYSLNNTLSEDSASGPSLTAYGGTLTPSGYYFGPNMGLSLSNAINPDVYSIDIHFYFDSVTVSFDNFQRIIDFKNRTTDSGLYSSAGTAIVYNVGGSSFSGSGPVLANGQMVDFQLTRSAAGLFSIFVNGTLALSFLDSTSLTTFSGPNNVIYFFMDDFQSLANYPNSPEAGSGLITFIEVTSTPLPAALPLFATGLAALGLLGWRRTRKSAALLAG